MTLSNDIACLSDALFGECDHTVRIGPAGAREICAALALMADRARALEAAIAGLEAAAADFDAHALACDLAASDTRVRGSAVDRGVDAVVRGPEIEPEQMRAVTDGLRSGKVALFSVARERRMVRDAARALGADGGDYA